MDNSGNYHKTGKGRCVKKHRLAQKNPTIDQPNKTDLIPRKHSKIDQESGNIDAFAKI
jgi:predicted transcriptional regulator